MVSREFKYYCTYCPHSEVNTSTDKVLHGCTIPTPVIIHNNLVQLEFKVMWAEDIDDYFEYNREPECPKYLEYLMETQNGRI